MRVLHVIDSGGMYGAEVMLLSLVEEQIRQGLNPVIASIGGHHCGEKAIEVVARKRNFSVETFRMLPGPNFIGAWKILQYAKSEKCDLLHSHGYKGNILFGFIPKRIRHLPLVTTVHGWTSTGTTFSRMRLYQWLDSLALSRMDTVVLVNEGMLIHPKLAGKRSKKFYVVNNGISAEAPDMFSCDALELRPGTVNIVAVGRLSPEKGFGNLLEAMALVVGNGIDVSLCLFGEGGERENLERLIVQLKLSDRVTMPGFVSNVSDTFSCFDFLVMPSLTEGLPITLLEAMRAGLPVIASSVGGIPFVIQDRINGYLVRPADVEGLCHVLLEAIRRKRENKMLIECANNIFHEVFTSEIMASAYAQLYHDVLDGENRQRPNG